MRGNVYARVARLEGRLGANRSGGVDMSEPPHPDIVAVLNAYGAMGAMMSNNSYRGSPRGLVR